MQQINKIRVIKLIPEIIKIIHNSIGQDPKHSDMHIKYFY